MKINSYSFCPVSDKRVNERVSRITAAFTVILIILFAMTQNPIPLVFLSIDFLFRASVYSRLSLTGIASRGIADLFSKDDKRINAGPKIFAARIGFVISGLSIIAYIFHAYLPAIVLAGLLGLFSFLEAAFGLCIACEIYPFVYRLLYNVRFQEQ